MELFALGLSCLANLSSRMANPASPQGLLGDARTPAQWLHLAAQTGLPARRVRWATRVRVAQRDLAPQEG